MQSNCRHYVPYKYLYYYRYSTVTITILLLSVTIQHACIVNKLFVIKNHYATDNYCQT